MSVVAPIADSDFAVVRCRDDAKKSAKVVSTPNIAAAVVPK
jgi:hypothetical protein